MGLWKNDEYQNAGVIKIQFSFFSLLYHLKFIYNLLTLYNANDHSYRDQQIPYYRIIVYCHNAESGGDKYYRQSENRFFIIHFVASDVLFADLPHERIVRNAEKNITEERSVSCGEVAEDLHKYIIKYNICYRSDDRRGGDELVLLEEKLNICKHRIKERKVRAEAYHRHKIYRLVIVLRRHDFNKLGSDCRKRKAHSANHKYKEVYYRFEGFIVPLAELVIGIRDDGAIYRTCDYIHNERDIVCKAVDSRLGVAYVAADHHSVGLSQDHTRKIVRY